MKVLRIFGWYLIISFLAYCILVGSYGGFSGDPNLREAESRVMTVDFPIIALTWPIWCAMALLTVAGAMGGARDRYQPEVKN